MKLTKREQMASEAFEDWIHPSNGGQSFFCRNYDEIYREMSNIASLLPTGVIAFARFIDHCGNDSFNEQNTAIALALWAVWPELEGLV